MKSLLMASLVATGVLFSGAALASADLAAAKCGKCHEMDKKKKGPAYKKTAAEYKGKPDAEAKLFKSVTDPNGDHPDLREKDKFVKEEDIRTVLKWILQQ